MSTAGHVRRARCPAKCLRWRAATPGMSLAAGRAMRKNKSKLALKQETIATLELAGVTGGLDPTSKTSDSGDTTHITRPGMASCWTCYVTHCCGPRR